MALKPYSSEQKDIARQIAKLRKRAEALEQKKRAPAISQIVRTMREYGISAEDVAAAFGKKTRAKTAAAKPAAGKTKRAAAKKPASPPKYQDPASSKTWTGHGKPPGWIVAADQNGTGRAQFLIEKA